MRIRLLWVLILIGLLAGSCGTVRPEPLAFVDQDARPGQSVIRVATWDATALTPAIEDWEQEHPTARVVIETRSPDEHHADALDPTTPSADIVAIDARHAEDFRNRTDLFTNLSTVVAGIEPGLPWRTAEGIADDGTATSVAVDTGGLALAVRVDLLQEVDDPNSGGTLARALDSVTTWCDLIEVGDLYSESTGRAFLPSASDIFEAVLNQSDTRFVDAEGERIHATNDAITNAWETAMLAIGTPGTLATGAACPELTGTTKRITAARTTGTTSWDTAISTGDVAALLAPSWMLEHIRTIAPETAGDWALHPIPGVTGSIGGTALAVSRTSEHQALATDLIEHLTRPTSQSTTFRDFGNLPASAPRYESAAVLDHREPFYGTSPIGQVYVDSVQGLTPPPAAEHDEEIMVEFRAAVARVDTGTQTPDEALNEAMWRIDLLLQSD